jgi:hypothetical protein
MIFIDHVIGDPLAKFTYHALGFSDAAEIFVFLSGLTCGIAYTRALARHGLSDLIWLLAKRAGRIYFYYASSSVAIILLVVGSIKYLTLQESFGISADRPLHEMLTALCLISPAPLSGILILYIMLTLFVIPPLLISSRRYLPLALAASAMIWAGAQAFPDALAPLTHRWYLNPFAWQLLFTIGMIIGMKWDSEHPILPALSQRRWVILAAWAIVIGALLYKLLSSPSGLGVAWLRFEPSTLADMKENLAPIRLLHFLSVALLFAVYFHRDSALLRWPICAPVINTGVHSLEIFSLAVVLDSFVNVIVLTASPSFVDRLLLDSIALLMLILAATAFTYRRGRRSVSLYRADSFRPTS